MQFERKIVMNNDVYYLSIPIDLVKHLGMKENSELIIQDEEGKHGKYMSIWVKEKGGE